MRFSVVFVFTLIKLSDIPPSESAPYPPLPSEGRPVTRVVTAVFTAVNTFSRTLNGKSQSQNEESVVFFQADPSADNSNRESSYDDGKRVGGASSVLTRADNSDNNRQTSNGYSNYGGSSDNNNRQSPTGNSNYGGSSDSNNRQYVPNNSNRDGYPDSNKSPVITFDYGGGSGSSGDNNRQGFTNNNRPSLSNDPIGVDLNRGAFNYAPYNVETTTMNYQNSDRRKEENYLSNSMTSYQGVNNQNTQEFQRPANSNHIRNQDIASNMKMVPDMNPILSPDQKISISIEYPTVNYERDDAEYSTRAPLKRPNKNRTTEKSQ